MKPSKKEIAKFQKKEQAQLAGREVNRVQDRKTGEYYDPKAKFDELMNKPEILASLNRLKIR
jgi:hypothetical protein